MFIMSKALLISGATVIVRVGRTIWYSELWSVCLLLYKVADSSPVSLQLLRGGMDLYEVPLSMCLCWVLG